MSEKKLTWSDFNKLPIAQPKPSLTLTWEQFQRDGLKKPGPALVPATPSVTPVTTAGLPASTIPKLCPQCRQPMAESGTMRSGGTATTAYYCGHCQLHA